MNRPRYVYLLTEPGGETAHVFGAIGRALSFARDQGIVFPEGSVHALRNGKVAHAVEDEPDPDGTYSIVRRRVL